MQNYTTIVGADARLDVNDPSTWNVTIKLERTSKHVLSANQLQNLKFVSDQRIGQYQSPAERDDAEALLLKIQDLHPWTGNRLRTKAKMLKPFDFRVLVGNDQSSEPAQRKSHICLSYNWWSDQWLKPGTGAGFGLSPSLVNDAYGGNFDIPESKFPIADTMWNALLAERQSEAEGVWIDQFCLDQKNPDEIQNALLLTERVYQTARKVVVPFENVLLWSDEARAIIKHIQAINAVPMNQRKDWNSWVKSADLYALGASAYATMKIEGSRWFRRIWCNHEMRMGNDFVFMIPIIERVTPDDHAENVCIMKLDCKAMLTLLQSSRTMQVGTGMGMEDIMRQGYFKETMIDFHLDQQPRAFMPVTVVAPDIHLFTPYGEISRTARGIKSGFNSVLGTLESLGAYGNQNPKDTFHVLLDAATSGLTTANEVNTLSYSEVVYMANVIAISIGDLSPLTTATNIKRWQDNIIPDLPRLEYSWAAFPSSDRAVGERGSNRVKLVPDLTFTSSGLQLPVIAAGAAYMIVQSSDLKPESVTMFRTICRGTLNFHRAATNQERLDAIKKRDDIVNLEKKKAKRHEISELYLRNFADLVMLAIPCEEDLFVNGLKEMQELGLYYRDEATHDIDDVDLVAQSKAFQSFLSLSDLDIFQSAATTADDDIDLESEQYKHFLTSWPKFRDYLVFFEKLLQFLTGPTWEYRDDKIDPDLRISRLTNGSQTGVFWSQMLALPDKEVVKDYWLVRPMILAVGSRPDIAEFTGLDMRTGGLWAVVPISLRKVGEKEDGEGTVEMLDEERANDVDIWDVISGLEDADFRPLSQDVLEFRLVSRGIRMFPRGEWQQPRWGKMALVHA